MLIPAFRILGVAAALGLVVACSDDPISAPASSSANLVVGPVSDQAVAGQVKICTFHGEGTFTTTQAQVNANTLIDPLETIGTVLDPECSVTWLANGQAGPFDVTVAQTGPNGFGLHTLAWFYINSNESGQFLQDPNPCDGTPILTPASVTVKVGGTAGAVIWFKQCPVQPPPPPPGVCNGLTPGYWVNWAQHDYTEEDMLLLLEGTIADGNIALAGTILGYGGPVAWLKLRRFVLANQLTLNLTAALAGGAEFPKTDGGNLTLTCTSATFPLNELGDALEDALAILAVQGVGSTNGAINALKDILDKIANL